MLLTDQGVHAVKEGVACRTVASQACIHQTAWSSMTRGQQPGRDAEKGKEAEAQETKMRRRQFLRGKNKEDDVLKAK